MNKFCPLCNKVLLEIGGENDREYFCQTRVKLKGCIGKYSSLPHYEDRERGKLIIWLAPPYKISTETERHISYIDVLRERDNDTRADQFEGPEWNQIAVTSEIHADFPEKLIKRIKLLIPFI